MMTIRSKFIMLHSGIDLIASAPPLVITGPGWTPPLVVTVVIHMIMSFDTLCELRANYFQVESKSSLPSRERERRWRLFKLEGFFLLRPSMVMERDL